jgi:hypothetical protein
MRKLLFLVLGFVLLVTLSATAQNNCVAVRGIAQEHLLDFSNPDWQGGRPGDGWVGPVQLILGKDEVLVGKLSENDGDPGPSNGTGQGRGGSYFFDFGADGSFVMRYGNAVWPDLKSFGGAAFTGKFRAQGAVDVTHGTGRFANATGNLATDGPFTAWNLLAPLPSGRFNNTITGTLCNVAPKPE